MRIPQVTAILTTYEPIPENLFNPILHESETAMLAKVVTCKCGEDNPDNFYKYLDKRRGREFLMQPCKKCYSIKNKKRYT